MTISAEEVTWCYRLLLGREPESEEVIQEHMKATSRLQLVRNFSSSPEYARYQGVALRRGVHAVKKSKPWSWWRKRKAPSQPDSSPRPENAVSVLSALPPGQVQDRAREVSGSVPPAARTADELRALVNTQVWFHTIELGRGVVTPGNKSAAILEPEADALLGALDLQGRSFLDVGAWNGYFSFEARRRGAMVLSVDRYTWTHPEFRGLEAYLLARRELGLLDIDYQVCDVDDVGATIEPREVTLFSGVFYHLYDPINGLASVAKATRDLIIVETWQDALNLDVPAMIYYPGSELIGDPTNWWGPNIRCVDALLRANGFDVVYYRDHPSAGRSRGIYHAFRSREAVSRLAPRMAEHSVDLAGEGVLASLRT